MDQGIAQVALEEIRKQLGKFEEIVEMLVTRSEASAPIRLFRIGL